MQQVLGMTVTEKTDQVAERNKTENFWEKNRERVVRQFQGRERENCRTIEKFLIGQLFCSYFINDHKRTLKMCQLDDNLSVKVDAKMTNFRKFSWKVFKKNFQVSNIFEAFLKKMNLFDIFIPHTHLLHHLRTIPQT